jgi:hypothetical protein
MVYGWRGGLLERRKFLSFFEKRSNKEANIAETPVGMKA